MYNILDFYQNTFIYFNISLIPNLSKYVIKACYMEHPVHVWPCR